MPNLLPGYDFISSAWMAKDGDGWDGDPRDMGDSVTPAACGFNSKGPVPQKAVSSSWHGIHVMGIIAAGSNNGEDISGIAGGARILPLRTLGRCGGYTSDTVAAMEYIAGEFSGRLRSVPAHPYRITVVNMSLGGQANTCPISYQRAINKLVSRGITVVVAAGNQGRNVQHTAPANCNNVIVVGSTNRQGDRSWYSNVGQNVDVSAPGGETSFSGNGILSLANSGQTSPELDSLAYLQGTSMAAPQVTALILLAASLKPGVSPQRHEQLLKETARAFSEESTCTTSQCGAGIIDAAAYLRAIEQEP